MVKSQTTAHQLVAWQCCDVQQPMTLLRRCTVGILQLVAVLLPCCACCASSAWVTVDFPTGTRPAVPVLFSPSICHRVLAARQNKPAAGIWCCQPRTGRALDLATPLNRQVSLADGHTVLRIFQSMPTPDSWQQVGTQTVHEACGALPRVGHAVVVVGKLIFAVGGRHSSPRLALAPYPGIVACSNFRY